MDAVVHQTQRWASCCQRPPCGPGRSQVAGVESILEWAHAMAGMDAVVTIDNGDAWRNPEPT
jgi:hypothetical protein